MKRTKAERRKHKFRIRNKILKRIKQDDIIYFNSQEELQNYVNKLADNPTICSCFICCNPRHSKLFKEKYKLTIQERKYAYDQTNRKIKNTNWLV